MQPEHTGTAHEINGSINKFAPKFPFNEKRFHMQAKENVCSKKAPECNF